MLKLGSFLMRTYCSTFNVLCRLEVHVHTSTCMYFSITTIPDWFQSRAQKNFFSLNGFSEVGTGVMRGSSQACASQYAIRSATAFDTCGGRTVSFRTFQRLFLLQKMVNLSTFCRVSQQFWRSTAPKGQVCGVHA